MVNTTNGTPTNHGNIHSKTAHRGTTPEVRKMNGQTAHKAPTPNGEKPEYVQRPLTREAHRWLMGHYGANLATLPAKCPNEVWRQLVSQAKMDERQVGEEMAKHIVERIERETSKAKLHVVPAFQPQMDKAITPKSVGAKSEPTAIEAAFAAAKADAPTMTQDEIDKVLAASPSVFKPAITTTAPSPATANPTPAEASTAPAAPAPVKVKKEKKARAANACCFYNTCSGAAIDKKPSWLMMSSGSKLIVKPFCVDHRTVLTNSLGVVFHTKAEVEHEVARRIEEKAEFEAALKRERDEKRALELIDKVVEFTVAK